MTKLTELLANLNYCDSWTVTNDVVNGRNELQFRAGCSKASPIVFTCDPDDLFDQDGMRFQIDLQDLL